MGNGWGTRGLQVGYKVFMSGLQVGYEWVTSGGQVGYKWVHKWV